LVGKPLTAFSYSSLARRPWAEGLSSRARSEIPSPRRNDVRGNRYPHPTFREPPSLLIFSFFLRRFFGELFPRSPVTEAFNVAKASYLPLYHDPHSSLLRHRRYGPVMFRVWKVSSFFLELGLGDLRGSLQLFRTKYRRVFPLPSLFSSFFFLNAVAAIPLLRRPRIVSVLSFFRHLQKPATPESYTLASPPCTIGTGRAFPSMSRFLDEQRPS